MHFCFTYLARLFVFCAFTFSCFCFFLPVFVYVLGRVVNKSGDACPCLFPFCVFW
ncbi:hypothetical protein HMPREF1581_01536 [Gardnerella vaginalis JCP8108]|uniref:Uncharacterized protein n=1 Tax=Gardnerella vaginalis JCP8108 TaxID=1261066 RepID=S4GJ73_GARVA|nr:hypothetical protein HMPREF1581_01536 [Gardnerella vaginalis JCP8108]